MNVHFLLDNNWQFVMQRQISSKSILILLLIRNPWDIPMNNFKCFKYVMKHVKGKNCWYWLKKKLMIKTLSSCIHYQSADEIKVIWSYLAFNRSCNFYSWESWDLAQVSSVAVRRRRRELIISKGEIWRRNWSRMFLWRKKFCLFVNTTVSSVFL